jgi:hypothetical protein
MFTSHSADLLPLPPVGLPFEQRLAGNLELSSVNGGGLDQKTDSPTDALIVVKDLPLESYSAVAPLVQVK